MRTKIGVPVWIALALCAAVARAGPARQYRGPENESPRAVALPGFEGSVGVDRLSSRSGRIEGWSRWEFWWETNRDRYLRLALARGDRAREAHAATQLLLTDSPSARLVSAEDVRSTVIPLLLERLESNDPEERAIAAFALGRTGAAAAFVPIRSMLEKGGPSDRRAGSLALGLLGEALAVPDLTAQLRRTGGTHAERACAALALGLLRSRESVPLLSRMLVETLGHHGRKLTELQCALADALGLIGHESSLRVLSRVASVSANRPVELRAAATIAIGRLGSAEGAAVLRKLLRDGQAELRRAAAQAAGRLGDPVLRKDLEVAFRKDPDPHVRGLAAVSLARIGGPKVAEALEAGLGIENPRAVRGFSALALGIHGERHSAIALRDLLDRPDESSLRAAAAISLGLMRDRAAAPALRSIARDRAADPGLRGYAIQALALMGDTRLRASMGGLAREYSGSGVRRAAAMALGLDRGLPAAPSILACLFEETDPWVKGAAIGSLSLCPRRSVLDSVVAVAKGRGFSREARKDALTALGVLGAEGRPPVANRFVEGCNYRSVAGAGAVLLSLF